MTDPDTLLRASRRAHELYGELLAVYAELGGLLTDERAEPARLAAATREATRITSALGGLEATLAPVRAAGNAPVDVRAVWKDVSGLAARASAANETLLARARTRRDAIMNRRLASANRPGGRSAYAVPAPRGAAIDARA